MKELRELIRHLVFGIFYGSRLRREKMSGEKTELLRHRKRFLRRHFLLR
jgi:hypothetical protein